MPKPTQDAPGMDKAEHRRMLGLARKHPVHAAFAMGGDGRAILVLDRRRPPRSMSKELRDTTPSARHHCFGTATVDPNEPKLVRFAVNRVASGMARKLAVALKGTGFSKVEIVLEDGTAVESAEHEDREQRDADAGPTASAQPAANALPTAATDDDVPPMPAEEPWDGAPPLDPPYGAAPAVSNEPSPGSDARTGNAVDPRRLLKMRMAWVATRARIEAEIRKVADGIAAADDTGEFGDALQRHFLAAVEPVLEALDESLAETLTEAGETPDPARASALVSQARATIGQYARFVAADPVIGHLDRNPFVPVAIGKTVTASLSTLLRAMAA